MSDKYYTIHYTEDGNVYIHEYKTKKEFLNDLMEGGYEEGIEFLNKIPAICLEDWGGNQGIIIKGEIVIPKPKEVIKEWDID